MTFNEMDALIKSEDGSEVTYRDRIIFLLGAEHERNHPIENLNLLIAMKDIRSVTIK